MGKDDNDCDPVAWAGGGGGWSGDWEPPPPPTTGVDPPKPGERRKAEYGANERLGSAGLICGRFIPPHRGHQYLIDFALQSVETLVVMVFAAPDDPILGALRVQWLQQMYPKATVMLAPQPPGDVRDWGRVIATHLRDAKYKATHFFTSEERYRPIAQVLSAKFVPVDPQRVAVKVSGTAVRANVVENFHYLAAPARSVCVRRVAVVGAESTGKTTLCTRLSAEMKLAMVPEYTRNFVVYEHEAGLGMMSPYAVQHIARSQIAAEDALAEQLAEGNTGVLVCDTDVRAVRLWANRLYDAVTPPWIDEEIAKRPYDLYLLCMPDIPFVGPKERDEPDAREKFHADLRRELDATGTPIVELSGSRDERFRAAADAIIGLYAPKEILSARARHLRG